MDTAEATVEERYALLVEALTSETEAMLGLPGKKGFGQSALQIGGRIFAMMPRGRLVVKLPKSRVDALVAEGKGVRFDANRGVAMKEWLTVDPAAEGEWVSLAREALAFVAAAK